MRRLSHFETLVFYDGVQIFTAKDQFDTRFICMLFEKGECSDKYLCAPISLPKLGQFLEGRIDLRDIFRNPEIKELYQIEASTDNLLEMPATPVAESLPEWLPEPGFFMEPAEPLETEVEREAATRRRAVIHCKLEPPEARWEPAIYAENLAQAVKLVQRLVKHAFRRFLRNLGKEERDRLLSAENYQLKVFAFSEGSFNIHMESSVPPDLFGHVDISMALERIDCVVSLSEEPAEAVQKLLDLGPHFAAAYKDLLSFISETDTSLGYSWAAPDRKISRNKISTSQAKPLYKAITERSELGSEIVRIVGKLTKVDEKTRTWRLTSEETNKEVSGSSEIDLAGLTIETERYEFICEERVEEEKGTGRELIKLYLRSYQKL